MLKLGKSIPNHILLYITLNSLLFGAVTAIGIMQILLGVIVIDFYILFLIGFINIGLFCTALRSLKDWKEFILKDGKKE